MKKANQKLKLLYLLRILYENTDEEHTMTVPQMISELAECGITAERKSIYDDLEQLIHFGFDICSRKSRTKDYYIGSRSFELPELKLLVDSVQSAKFITHKKSKELIQKLEGLTSRHNASKLRRQVVVADRVKTFNEKIYYNVDRIHEAIAENRQITFKYFDIDVHKKKVFRKDGGLYTESPVSLTWNDGKYYLITYKEKYSNYVQYRVDRMENVEISDCERVLAKEPFDISKYSKELFQMFSGKKERVTIQFTNDSVGAVYDRFGTDIPIIGVDDNHFLCDVTVAVSRPFLTWVISFGDKAKIIAPAEVVKEMKDLLRTVRRNYRPGN